MLVKGAVIKPMVRFVRERYPEHYEAWRARLAAETRTVMDDGIVTSWYPLQRAMIEPTAALCELVDTPADEVAWELGRFSADFALRGIFRIFVRLGSPGFIVKRASHVFSTYYSSAVLRVHESGPKGATVRIVEFDDPHPLVERRIGGYMERAVEISGARVVRSEVTALMSSGDPYTEIRIAWS